MNLNDIEPRVSDIRRHVTPQPGNYRFRPYTAVTAGLQLLPEGLYLAQFHLVKGDRHLSNGVIPAEAVVVQDLEVESSLSHLLIRKAWGEKKERKKFQKMENIFLSAESSSLPAGDTWDKGQGHLISCSPSAQVTKCTDPTLEDLFH